MIEIFTPTGDSINITATTSANERTALGTFSSLSGGTVRIHNDGTAAAFIKFGTVTTSATVAAGMRIPSGAIEVFQLGSGVTHIAHITSSGTASLNVTPGQGN